MTGVMPMPSEMTHTSVRPSFGQRPGGMNEIAPEVFETVLDQLRGSIGGWGAEVISSGGPPCGDPRRLFEKRVMDVGPH